MNMVRDKSPGITDGGCFMKDSTETGEEVSIIFRILKNRVSFDPPDDDMVESAGCINACFARHGQIWHKNK
jgi:hypothetical protein